MTIQKIGVLSCAKITGVLYAALGLLIGGFFSLFSIIGAAAGMAGGDQSAAFGLLFGAGAIVILPLFYGAIGFVMTALMVALFNVATRFVGGVEIEVTQ